MSSITPSAGVGAHETAQERGPTILRPLHVRDFRLLFGGEAVSLLGDQFHFVALTWLVLQLTGSGLAIGTVLMTAAIPRAIFMLVGGAFSDRFSPRLLLIGSNAIRGIVVGIVAGLVLTGRAELWHLYVLAGIFGIVDAFFYPAIRTLVPMLVSERQLSAANALVVGAEQVAGLVGPALAGLLIATVNTGPAFAIDAVSFAVASVAATFIAGGRRAAGHSALEAPSILGTIGSGIAIAWRDPAVRSLFFIIAAINFAFTGPTSVGLAWLAENRFTGDSATFGLLLSAWGGGAIIGAIIGGSVVRLPRFGTSVLTMCSVVGVGLAGIGLAPTVGVALAIIGPMGLLIGILNVQVVAWLQGRVTPEARGRVMSLVMFGSVGLAPLSLALAGALVDLGVITAMFLAAGGIVIVAAVAGLAWGAPAQMDRAAT
jgi:predicted MFS family arabinose efflux permease